MGLIYVYIRAILFKFRAYSLVLKVCPLIFGKHNVSLSVVSYRITSGLISYK